MVQINSYSEEVFKINGVPYNRIYQPLRLGSTDIAMVNVYDTKQLICRFDFRDLEIDGVAYLSQNDAMEAIIPISYFKKDAVTPPVVDIVFDESDIREYNVDGRKVYRLANRDGASDIYSSKGYIILRPNIVDGENILTSEMFVQENAIYVIRDSFKINSVVKLPANCTLHFCGGVVYRDSNVGRLDFDRTTLSGEPLIMCDINGTLLNGEINVRWFGVFGDGVTDDSARLNALFAAIGNLGSYNIYFPLGTYMLRSALVVPRYADKAYIYGEQAITYARTIITTDVELDYIVECAAKGVTMKKLQFLGKGDPLTDLTPNSGVRFRRADVPNDADDSLNDIDCIVKDCHFFWLGKGVSFYGRQCEVSNCAFTLCHKGITVEKFNNKGLGGGSHRGYRLRGNLFHAMRNYAGVNATCIINYTANAYGFQIVDNFNDSRATFYVGDLLDSVMSGNLMYNLLHRAIECDKVYYSSITGNVFANTRKYSDTYTSVNTESFQGLFIVRADGMSFVGNTIINTSSGAIIIDNSVNSTTISSNSIMYYDRDGASPAITINGEYIYTLSFSSNSFFSTNDESSLLSASHLINGFEAIGNATNLGPEKRYNVLSANDVYEGYDKGGNVRPAYAKGHHYGAVFYDLTIDKIIVWDGDKWVDSNGVAV